MKLLDGLSRTLPLLTLAVACSHSDPTGSWVPPDDGPFGNGAPPVRLTYSVSDDGWPTVSADGRWLSYRFERGTNDRDFCAGVLPAAGGQRVAEVCAWELTDASSADDFRAYLFVGEDRALFTRHSSGVGNQAPQQAGVYLGEVGAERDANKVLDLLVRPAGAQGIWSYLIDPIWLGDNAVVTLASSTFIGQAIPFGPVDTVYQGVEIARIDLGSRPATVTSLVAAPDAVGWAIDQAAGQLFYHRRYYSSTPGSGAFEITADTIFRVPVTGGTPEAVYGRAPEPDDIAKGFDGFAIVDGRLFVTAHQVRFTPPDPEAVTRSELLEIRGDGTAISSHVMISAAGDRWTRLTASPDGSHLVVAREAAGQKDLYLLEIDS